MSLHQRPEPEPPYDPRVIRRAQAWRRWFQEGELTRQGLLTFQAWLLHSRENRDAYRYVESIDHGDGASRALVHIDRANELTAPPRRPERRGPWRWLLLILALLVIVAAVGLVATDRGLQTLPLRIFADHSAGVGETERVQLPDGTVIQLGARTAFDLEARGATYALDMIEGEIHVTQPEGSPRLEISSPNGGVDAEGARFAYRDLGGTALVGVEDGEVVALLEGGAATARRVTALQEVAFTEEGLSEPRPMDLESVAWRRGRLGRQVWTLDALAAEIRRHHPGLVLIIDREAAGRSVTLEGTQSTRMPLSILEAAAARLGIAYRPLLGGRLVVLGNFDWANYFQSE